MPGGHHGVRRLCVRRTWRSPGRRVLLDVGIQGGRCSCGPGVGQLGHPGRRRLGRRPVIATHSAWWMPIHRLVHAALDPASSAALHLVGHGIRQAGDGPRGADDIAVAVQQGMELPQGGRAVSAQDGQACGTQLASGEGGSARSGGGQRAVVEVRGPTTVAPGDDRVELVPDRGQGCDDRPPVAAEGQEVGVYLVQRVHQGVPLGLPFDAEPQRHPRDASQRHGRRAPVALGWIGGATRPWRRQRFVGVRAIAGRVVVVVVVVHLRLACGGRRADGGAERCEVGRSTGRDHMLPPRV